MNKILVFNAIKEYEYHRSQQKPLSMKLKLYQIIDATECDPRQKMIWLKVPRQILFEIFRFSSAVFPLFVKQTELAVFTIQ